MKSTRRAAIAALLAVVCVAGRLVSLAHLATGGHILCAEHGEVEDLPSVAHVGEIAHEYPGFGHEAGPLEFEHDHCLFAAFTSHASAAAARRADALSIAEPTRWAAQARVGRPKHLRALYRLAPKTSPPVPPSAQT